MQLSNFFDVKVEFHPAALSPGTLLTCTVDNSDYNNIRKCVIYNFYFLIETYSCIHEAPNSLLFLIILSHCIIQARIRIGSIASRPYCYSFFDFSREESAYLKGYFNSLLFSNRNALHSESLIFERSILVHFLFGKADHFLGKVPHHF